MTNSDRELNIDIPVKLSSVKAVFSIGSLAFEGGSSRFSVPPESDP